MAVTLNQLGTTLTTQLSNIVNGGDANVPASPDTFLTWCTPGIPFDPSDFDFAAGGFGAAADAAQYRRLLQQAFSFAQLVDFLPSLAAPYDLAKQEYINRPSQQRLSVIYSEILRFAKVVKQELTEDEQKKLEKFRGLLRTTKVERNLVTDEEKEVTVDGPVLQAYYEKMANYIEARTLYNTKRALADGAVGPEGIAAVADWSANSELYWLRVRAARDAWVSGGYRNEVDQMNAYIDAVTRRDMNLWRQGLVEDLEKAEVAATTPGSVFNFTTLVPGNFAHAAGWTEYGVTHERAQGSTHHETSSWSAGAGVGWGFWSFGANASSSSESFNSNYSTESFKLTMQLAPVIISRPWFSPEFFKNRGWTLKPGQGWMYDDMPSDGQRPPNGPNGNFLGYQTMALFARNIVIESEEFASAYESSRSQMSVGGSVGWGPFRLAGNYASSEANTAWSTQRDGATLRVPGMQIIGFVNELIGKAPNPLEGLEDDDFE